MHTEAFCMVKLALALVAFRQNRQWNKNRNLNFTAIF